MPIARMRDQWVSLEGSFEDMVLPENSPFPGKLKLDPPQIGIVQALDDPNIQHITLMCSSQVGKTLILCLVCSHVIMRDPQPVLFMHPTEDEVTAFVRDKLRPLIDSNPGVRSRTKYRGTGTSKARAITFRGGMIRMVTATLARSFRGTTAKKVIVDECDVFSSRLQDPLGALNERLTMYGSEGKMIVASTPIDYGESNIAKRYENSDRREFMTPCYHCDGMFSFKWEHVKDDALWCPQCGAQITDDQRVEMIDKGFWEATNEGNPGHAGFYMNQLHSPRIKLADILQKRREMDERTFMAGVMGVPDDFAGKTFDARGQEELILSLYVPREFDQPDIITIGVDVHADRFELSVLDWSGDNGSRYDVTRHVRMYHDGVERDESWLALDEEVKKYQADKVFVDAGYFLTSSSRPNQDSSRSTPS